MSEWPDARIERLKCLWTEGHSTAEIGRRMGLSKNAVVGKAHRLSLDARPSPIQRSDATQPAKPVSVRVPRGASTLPVIGFYPTFVPISEPSLPPPVASPMPAASPERALRPTRPVKACLWPMWSGPKPTHEYCGAPVGQEMPRKPGQLVACYCAEHAAKARGRARVGL
jgi:GcrA cell cycle regulator